MAIEEIIEIVIAVEGENLTVATIDVITAEDAAAEMLMAMPETISEEMSEGRLGGVVEIDVIEVVIDVGEFFSYFVSIFSKLFFKKR